MPMTVENEDELKEVMQYTRFRPDREFIKRYGYVLMSIKKYEFNKCHVLDFH